MIQAPQGHVGLPHGRRQRGLGGVYQVAYENIFLFKFFLIEIDFKYHRDILDTKGDVKN